MSKYFLVWFKTALLSVQATFANRLGALLFTLGKILRFVLFIAFLMILNSQIKLIGGYTLSQMMIFFLIFNLFDLFGQVFFRGIYWFRNQVISGEFDGRLVKPINPLFQALTNHTDILDVLLLIIVVAYLFNQITNISQPDWISFTAIAIAGMITITAIHIAVAGMGVITTEVDHTIMIYRDVSQMARFPIDIYTDAIRALLTFVIPVALAFTFPAKALLGLLSPITVIVSLIASFVFFWLSLKFWHYALTQYSSASS